VLGKEVPQNILEKALRNALAERVAAPDRARDALVGRHKRPLPTRQVSLVLRYVTFSSSEELRQPLLAFLNVFAGINETDSASLFDMSSWEADEVTALAAWK
jgi:hypothetical protein